MGYAVGLPPELVCRMQMRQGIVPCAVDFGAVGLGADCGPAPATFSYNLSALDLRFRAAIDPFLAQLQSTGLSNFFQPAIGLRSLDRQCWAKCEGGSFIKDPSRGSHPNGFAIDFHATGPQAPGVFKAANGKYSKWATGLDAESHTQVYNYNALELWRAFGNLVAQHPKLEWGGNWKKTYTDKGYPRDKVLLGFDPYHVQLKDYEKYVTGPRYKCVGPKAVPMTKTESAVAAGQEWLKSPWFWALAAGGAGYFWWRAQKRR